jgi:hypothetical protein
MRSCLVLTGLTEQCCKFELPHGPLLWLLSQPSLPVPLPFHAFPLQHRGHDTCRGGAVHAQRSWLGALLACLV